MMALPSHPHSPNIRGCGVRVDFVPVKGSMPLPFEQQPNESAKAFAAFSIYLNLGVERSTQAVAKSLAKSEQLVRRWSARWQWLARVQAHAEHFEIGRAHV